MFPLLFLWCYNIKKISTLIIVAVLIFVLSPLLNTELLYDPQFAGGRLLQLRSSNGTGAVLRCLGSYVVGIATYRVYETRKDLVSRCGKYWWLIMLAAILLMPFRKADILLDLLMGLLLLAVLEDNWLTRFFSSRVVYYLGLISYSLYINHKLFITSLENYMHAHNLAGDTRFYLIAFVVTVVGTATLSHLTYVFIEKRLTNQLKKWRVKDI
ncbi:MAG: hypothetical protein QM610_10705 [Chitinophagaceae bacterium]